MSRAFYKQLIFISLGVAIITIGGVIIYGATVGGNLKVNPILGHDLDLDAKYYGYDVGNTQNITTEDFSISAWFKQDSAKRVNILGNGYWYNQGYWGIMAESNGKIYGQITTADKEYGAWITSPSSISYNTWYHVAVSYDRDGLGTLYINGAKVASTSISAYQDTLEGYGAYTFRVGAQVLSNYVFNGNIRDVKINKGGLWSDAQVLYQAQHPFDYTANAGTLTDYWRLDEGTGTTLYGKVNNLTLSNVLAWTTQPKIKMVKQENTTTTGNNPAEPSSAVVGWWKMDEGTGQYAYDVSGNGNTGTLGTSTVADGADPTWTTGKLGKGLSFDGVDDYVDVGNSANLRFGTGDFTMSVWFKATSVSSYIMLIGKDSNSARDWIFAVGATANKLSFAGITPVKALDSTVNLTANQWTHGVVTRASGLTTLYVNGQASGSTITITNNFDLTNNIQIGARECVGNRQYFNGLIDDVRIYNRALSAGEVAQMYNSTKDGYLGKIKVSTGLVGYWKMDEASWATSSSNLTPVKDYSGKNNNGAPYNHASTTAGQIGRAGIFDGVDDYVSVADNASLNPTTEITLSAWVNFSSFSDTKYDTFIGKRTSKDVGGCAYQYGFSNYYSGGYITFFLDTTDGGLCQQMYSNTQLSVNQWYHLVATYKASSGVANIYINGRLDKTGSFSGNIETDTYPLWLSGRSGSSYYFNGLIDEVKIWNYARSAEQIKNDYVIGSKHREE